MFRCRFVLFLCFAAIASVHGSAQDRADAAPSRSLDATTDAIDEAWLEPYRADAVDRWENEIQKLEAQDQQQPDPPDGILFIGSSSIRRWDDIATDMAPYRPIQRGYGGSKFSNVAVFAKRLIRPHQYRAMVVFVANDVVGKETDHSPELVEKFARHIVQVSRQHQPGAPVFLIEITPTKSRWDAWPKIREVNARLRELALSTPHTYFIPTASHYLHPDGSPRTELFVDDLLHLNEEGYDLWGKLIRRRLDDVLRQMAGA